MPIHPYDSSRPKTAVQMELLPEQYLKSGFSRPIMSPFQIKKQKIISESHVSFDPVVSDMSNMDKITLEKLKLQRPRTSRSSMSVSRMNRPSTSKSVMSNTTQVNEDLNPQDIFEFTRGFLEKHDRKVAMTDDKNRVKIDIPEEDPAYLHEKFMKQMEEFMNSRPRTAASKRSKSPGTVSNNESTVCGKSVSLPQQQPLKNKTKAITQDNVPLVTPSKKNQQNLSKEQAKTVVEFFRKSPLVANLRLKNLKTLADWKLENQSKERIWDANAFSAQAFMSSYIKKRDQEEKEKMKHFMFQLGGYNEYEKKNRMFECFWF